MSNRTSTQTQFFYHPVSIYHCGLYQFNIFLNTLRLSSAALSFLLISSSDNSFFLSGDSGNSPLVSRVEGLKMSSNAWPEARLLSSFTWMSAKQDNHLHPSSSDHVQPLSQTGCCKFIDWSSIEELKLSVLMCLNNLLYRLTNQLMSYTRPSPLCLRYSSEGLTVTVWLTITKESWKQYLWGN